MKHIEPRQQGDAPHLAHESTKAPWSRTKILLALTATIGLLGFGMGHFFQSPSGDHISDATKTKLTAGFAHTRSLTMEAVKPEELESALDTMRMEPATRRDMEGALIPSNNQSPAASSKLVWITLWDFASEDGDVVHLSSGGYELDVVLKNEPMRMAVPVDATGTVRVTGTHDGGGGGITVAVMSGSQQISLPPMQEGQTLSLPVN